MSLFPCEFRTSLEALSMCVGLEFLHQDILYRPSVRESGVV